MPKCHHYSKTQESKNRGCVWEWNEVCESLQGFQHFNQNLFCLPNVLCYWGECFHFTPALLLLWVYLPHMLPRHCSDLISPGAWLPSQLLAWAWHRNTTGGKSQSFQALPAKCCFPSSILVTVTPLVLYKTLIPLPCQTILLQRLQMKTRKRG